VKRRALILCAIMPCLGSCSPTGAASSVGQPTPQAQLMQSMLGNINQIRAFVYGGGSQADATQAAQTLVASSQRIAELFPPGQASNDYVDMGPERAGGAPAAMSQSATLLLTAVQTGNPEKIGDQLAATERDGCGFCHLSSVR